VTSGDRPAGERGSEGAGVSPRLLEILVCPVTRGPLKYDAARQELISRGANLAFPIQRGIPVMLVDEARDLDDQAGVPKR
jgi:uncharacterized protein YbaR (Trm112 family)